VNEQQYNNRLVYKINFISNIQLLVKILYCF